MKEVTKFLCWHGCPGRRRPNISGGEGGKVPSGPAHEPVAKSNRRKCGVIRRAAFQKPGPATILMITQRNFDRAAGFCQPLLSDRFRPAPIRSHTANLVSGASETSED